MPENILWWIGGFIFVLTPIVLVHELGHFIVARINNIRVDEFGIGFPPRSVTLFTWRGTRFVLGSIPIGGYVKPAGEDDPSIPDGLAASSPMARLTTLAAGSVFNFLFTIVIFSIMFMLPRAVNQVVISEIAPNSPAETSGLMSGDILMEINGLEIGESSNVLVSEISGNAGQEVTLVVDRSGSMETIQVVPRLPGTYDSSQEGSLGIRMEFLETDEIIRTGFFSAIGQSLYTIYDIIYQTITLPFQQEVRFVSVVGISQIAGEAARSTVQESRPDILWVTGLISVALGFTNLLPIPALDGGRIVFVIIEWIRGKRIEPEREGVVHAIGMMLLLLLMVFLVVQDIMNPIIPS